MGVTAPDPEQPAEVAPEPAAAPQPTPAASDSPWAKDLEAFEDPNIRSQVDDLLRSRQSYATKLEQQLAEAQEAQRLYGDLTENPAETTFALINEVYGPEAAQAFAAQFEGDEEQPTYEPTAEQPQQLDPRIEQAVNYIEQQQAAEAYDEEMARVEAEHPGLQPDLFHPFVAAADGDFDDAYVMYENWVNGWNATHETSVEEQAAPPVMGEGQTTPPTTQEHKSLGDAIDSFLAANRPTQDPPPVS